MKLSKNTFGKTPAAIYLADYLNSLDKPIVSKRAGKVMTGFRNTFTQLANANAIGVLSAHNLAHIVNTLRKNFYAEVGDTLASQLVTNILVGEMKSLLRKSSEIRKIELLQNKIFSRGEEVGEVINRNGYKVAEVSKNNVDFPHYTVDKVRDDINADTLTEKWKVKMKKRNKTINNV